MNALVKKSNIMVELSERITRHYNVDPYTEVVFSNIHDILNKELVRLSTIKHKYQYILDTPIHNKTNLGLSQRAINLFIDNNIKTLGEVLNYSQSQVIQFKNCGVTTLKEISDLIGSLEIEWKY